MMGMNTIEKIRFPRLVSKSRLRVKYRGNNIIRLLSKESGELLSIAFFNYRDGVVIPSIEASSSYKCKYE